MKIENGNIVLSSSGIPVTVAGEELALQKAEILLKTPKGSFIFDRDFGSRINEMELNERENSNALLFEYALEVTEKIPGVKIIDTQYTPGKGIVTIACGEKFKEVTVELSSLI